jgi:hypothetical protein
VPAPDPRRVRSPSVPSVEVSPSRGLRKAPCRMTVEIWPCNESWCQVVGHTSWHASRVARAYRASENRMLIGRYGASGQLRDGRMAEAPEHGCSKGAGRGRGRTRAFQSSPPRPKNSRSAGWDAWVAARHSRGCAARDTHAAVRRPAGRSAFDPLLPQAARGALKEQTTAPLAKSTPVPHRATGTGARQEQLRAGAWGAPLLG